MRIDIQKELKSNEWERYKADNKKDAIISALVSIVMFSCAVIGIGFLINRYNKLDFSEFSILLAFMVYMVFLVFFIGLAIGFYGRFQYARKEMAECDHYIKWLNDHKEYAYCEGEVWDSLESCKYVKLSEVEKN